jgi:protease I
MARIAFILDNMFEDSEFKKPFSFLQSAGHEAIVIGSKRHARLTGKNKDTVITTHASIDDVSPEDFDALVIPGGYSPDHLRTNQKMVNFTRAIFEAGKPVAAICHAGSMLVEADIVSGKRVTSWGSIKTDLINAGANWVDDQVVEDGNLITSRNPQDLPAFCDAILKQISAIAEGPSETALENLAFQARDPQLVGRKRRTSTSRATQRHRRPKTKTVKKR